MVGLIVAMPVNGGAEHDLLGQMIMARGVNSKESVKSSMNWGEPILRPGTHAVVGLVTWGLGWLWNLLGEINAPLSNKMCPISPRFELVGKRLMMCLQLSPKWHWKRVAKFPG